MEKQMYENAEIQVIELQAPDIICTSGDGKDEYDNVGEADW